MPTAIKKTTREAYLPGCLYPSEVAKTYGVSESVVWDAMKSGSLRSRINTFTDRMIPPEAIDEWAQANGMVPRKHTPTWMLPDYLRPGDHSTVTRKQTKEGA